MSKVKQDTDNVFKQAKKWYEKGLNVIPLFMFMKDGKKQLRTISWDDYQDKRMSKEEFHSHFKDFSYNGFAIILGSREDMEDYYVGIDIDTLGGARHFNIGGLKEETFVDASPSGDHRYHILYKVPFKKAEEITQGKYLGGCGLRDPDPDVNHEDIEILGEGSLFIMSPSKVKDLGQYKQLSDDLHVKEITNIQEFKKKQIRPQFRTKEELGDAESLIDRDCLYDLAQQESPSHDARQSITAYLLHGQDLEVNEVIDVFRTIHPADYNYEKIKYQVNHIKEKGYKSWTCDKIRKKLGACVGEDNCKWKDSLSYGRKGGKEKEKEEEKEGVHKYFREKTDSGKPRDFNPKALADDIMEKYHIRTMEDNFKPWIYEDGYWKPKAEARITDELTRRLGEWYKPRRERSTYKYIKNVTHKQRRKFNRFRWKIPLKNGVYDVKTGELEDFKPELLNTFRLPVKYDPNASTKKIKEFLYDVFGSEAKVKTLLEIVGMSLVPTYPIQKALMLLGEEDQGKSTFLNLTTILLGEENVSGEKLQELCNSKYSTAKLYGKLANIRGDLSDRDVRNAGNFKELTGRDMGISAQEKWEKKFQFTNYATLMFSANKPPSANGKTDAFYKRWIIIELPNQFVHDPDPNDPHEKEKDPQILEKLGEPEVLSGFLNLAIKGLERVLERGRLTIKQSIDHKREIYEAKSDQYSAFTMENIRNVEGARIPRGDVFERYKKWNKEKEGFELKPKNVFVRKMNQYTSGKMYRPSIQGKQVRCWKGIYLKGKEIPKKHRIKEEPKKQKKKEELRDFDPQGGKFDPSDPPSKGSESGVNQGESGKQDGEDTMRLYDCYKDFQKEYEGETFTRITFFKYFREKGFSSDEISQFWENQTDLGHIYEKKKGKWKLDV